MNYIRITKDNIDKEHICCAMSGKQSIMKKEWMKKRFDEEERAFLTADLGSAKELAQLLRQIPDERKKKALMCFHWAKYGNFDTSKPFLPQYERNLKVLHEYLKELTE